MLARQRIAVAAVGKLWGHCPHPNTVVLLGNDSPKTKKKRRGARGRAKRSPFETLTSVLSPTFVPQANKGDGHRPHRPTATTTLCVVHRGSGECQKQWEKAKKRPW